VVSHRNGSDRGTVRGQRRRPTGAAVLRRTILIKETGVPNAAASAGYSEARQASFYKELRARLPAGAARAFAYFAAFYAPWRAQDVTGVPGPHPEEAYWGLYDSARRAKPAVDQLPPLAQDPTSRNSH
jgi:exo-beta-1,3-glucanase (GH17 family)